MSRAEPIEDSVHISRKVRFLEDGRMVRRFHVVNTIQTNTVGEHSFGVAAIAHLLGGDHNTVLSGLFHDMAEQFFGDIPSPAKRAMGAEARDKIEEQEIEELKRYGLFFPLTDDGISILKLADCFDGMLFCLREMQLGNRGEIVEAFNRYESYVLDELKRLRNSPDYHPQQRKAEELYEHLRNRASDFTGSVPQRLRRVGG